MKKNDADTHKTVIRMIGTGLLLSVSLVQLASLSGCSRKHPFSRKPDPVLNPRLVSKVTTYVMPMDSTDWTQAHVYDFTYENGYPVTIVDTDDAGTYERRFEYTFENGVPVKRVEHNNDNGNTVTIEYNGGRAYSWSEVTGDGVAAEKAYIQYGNGGDYFTMVLRERNMAGETPDQDEYAEENDSVNVFTENGLLKKTVNTGMYAYWAPSVQKEWLRFNGIYTADYDDNGIVHELSAVYREGNDGVESKYELKVENGVVTEVIRFAPDENGEFKPEEKFVFEYTENVTSASRYSLMINSFLVGEQSNYYMYLWN